MRNIGVNDAEKLAELECVLFPDNAFNESTIRNEILLGDGIVETDEGEIIAYVLLRRTEDLLDLTRVGVLPAYQRQGIASRMLEAVIQRGMRLMLCVRQENKGALRLYIHYGFKIVGRLDASEPCWVMLRELPT